MSASGNSDLAARLQRAEQALANALEERARLWDDANRRAAAERELAETRRMLDQMKGSPSWRLTAPLRAAKNGLKRQRQLVKRGASALRGR